MTETVFDAVENIVVGALGQQDEFARTLPRHQKHGRGEPDSEVVTRDIINAIAKRLDGASDLFLDVGADQMDVDQGENVADWLRTQGPREEDLGLPLGWEDVEITE